MKKTTVEITCDRCGEMIAEKNDRAIEFSKDGLLPIMHRGIPMDLCDDCYVIELETLWARVRVDMGDPSSENGRLASIYLRKVYGAE